MAAAVVLKAAIIVSSFEAGVICTCALVRLHTHVDQEQSDSHTT